MSTQEIRERWEGKQEAVETQDNLATACPIFIVQQKIRDLGYCGEDWAEGHEWRDSGNDFGLPEDEAEEAELERKLEEGEDLDCWDKFFYRERWEYVQPFLTKAAAQWYIDSNAHNLNEPRIYVGAGYRNPEWDLFRKAPTDIATLLAMVEELEAEADRMSDALCSIASESEDGWAQRIADTALEGGES